MRFTFLSSFTYHSQETFLVSSFLLLLLDEELVQRVAQFSKPEANWTHLLTLFGTVTWIPVNVKLGEGLPDSHWIDLSRRTPLLNASFVASVHGGE